MVEVLEVCWGGYTENFLFFRQAMTGKLVSSTNKYLRIIKKDKGIIEVEVVFCPPKVGLVLDVVSIACLAHPYYLTLVDGDHFGLFMEEDWDVAYYIRRGNMVERPQLNPQLL